MISKKDKAKIIYGEEMIPCPKCGSYEIKGQTPVKSKAKADAKSLLKEYANMKLKGTDYLEGPCYLMCFNCFHKAPSVDCSGRTATDVGNDPEVWSEMKNLWNNQK